MHRIKQDQRSHKQEMNVYHGGREGTEKRIRRIFYHEVQEDHEEDILYHGSH